MRNLGVLLLLFCFSCSESKNLHQTHKENLSVSFFSIGAGIDYPKKVELDKFIESFQKSESVTLVIEKHKWGKEGEEDYCIDLSPLSQGKRGKFIEDAQQLLKTSKLVRVNEVDGCKKQ